MLKYLQYRLNIDFSKSEGLTVADISRWLGDKNTLMNIPESFMLLFRLEREKLSKLCQGDNQERDLVAAFILNSPSKYLYEYLVNGIISPKELYAIKDMFPDGNYTFEEYLNSSHIQWEFKSPDIKTHTKCCIVLFIDNIAVKAGYENPELFDRDLKHHDYLTR